MSHELKPHCEKETMTHKNHFVVKHRVRERGVLRLERRQNCKEMCVWRKIEIREK